MKTNKLPEPMLGNADSLEQCGATEYFSDTTEELEEAIDQSEFSVLDACVRLHVIHVEKRYEVKKFDTFEDYCKQRFELSKSCAYQKSAAGKVFLTLSAAADLIPHRLRPKFERHVRPLTRLLPDEQIAVWKGVTELENVRFGALTTDHVLRVIRELGFVKDKKSAKKLVQRPVFDWLDKFPNNSFDTLSRNQAELFLKKIQEIELRVSAHIQKIASESRLTNQTD